MQKHPYKGTYLVIEGPGGCGKSLQGYWLSKLLKEDFPNNEIVTVREPGGTKIAEVVRQVLLDERNQATEPLAEALLFAAARVEVLQKVVRPALERGAIVVSDRSIFSNLAYQGYAGDLGVDTVWHLNEQAIGNLFPDVVFFLRVGIETGWQRIQQGRNLLIDRFDREREFYERTCEGYDWLAEKYPELFVVVDGSLPVVELSEVIREKALALIKERDFGREGTIGKERE